MKFRKEFLLEGHNSKALDTVSGIFEGCGFTTYLSQLKLGQYKYHFIEFV
jgi:hypothetical protein